MTLHEKIALGLQVATALEALVIVAWIMWMTATCIRSWRRRNAGGAQ